MTTRPRLYLVASLAQATPPTPVAPRRPSATSQAIDALPPCPHLCDRDGRPFTGAQVIEQMALLSDWLDRELPPEALARVTRRPTPRPKGAR